MTSALHFCCISLQNSMISPKIRSKNFLKSFKTALTVELGLTRKKLLSRHEKTLENKRIFKGFTGFKINRGDRI